MPGYLYILKNCYMPNLVKIGFTERDPKTRAAELSGFTGVPGNFEIVFSWFVADAADIEKRVHLELAAYRRTGEFFELTPDKAKSSVAAALRQWGVIGPDGLSFEAKKVLEQERAKAEKRRQIAQHKRDVADFEAAIRSIIDELEDRETRAGVKAYAATELKGFFSIFKSPDTPRRKQETRIAIESARNSLAKDLNLSWLVLRPSQPIIMPEDVFLVTGNGKTERTSAEQYEKEHYVINLKSFSQIQGSDELAGALLNQLNGGGTKRLPKGTAIENGTGWVFDGRRLINKQKREVLDWARLFSERTPKSSYHRGRTFSDESNLGAYHSETLRLFVGEIPLM